MAPEISHQININSYTFEDANNRVIVHCYASAILEQKDIDVFTDLDSLEVSTPGISFVRYENQLIPFIYPFLSR
jgi:hypothetical protein